MSTIAGNFTAWPLTFLAFGFIALGSYILLKVIYAYECESIRDVREVCLENKKLREEPKL